MSVGENNEKTSSADSGSSQNCRQHSVSNVNKANNAASARQRDGAASRLIGHTYASPVAIVGGDLLGLRQAEDALLEGEFGVGGAHRDACHITHSALERGGREVCCW